MGKKWVTVMVMAVILMCNLRRINVRILPGQYTGQLLMIQSRLDRALDRRWYANLVYP